VTLTAAGLAHTGTLVYNLIKRWPLTAVGGPSIGADPIVAAVLAEAFAHEHELKGFLVRKEAKGHGKGGLLVGPELTEEDRVVLVEDVVTTGESLQHAVDVVRETGAIVDRIIVLVDREEGARDRFLEQDIHFSPIFTLDMIVDAANQHS
jgi:orotate phosphoribosyltransferase